MSHLEMDLDYAPQRDVTRYIRHGKTLANGSDLWRTPRRLFNILNADFNFTRDAAASRDNRLTSRFWDEQDNALEQNWEGERLFCNPPFSMVSEFLSKAHEAELAVFVVPARTQTTYFLHQVFANPHCHQIMFLHRGIRFLPPKGLVQSQAGTRAPLPTCILVYRNEVCREKIITSNCSDTLMPLAHIAGPRKGRPVTYNSEEIDKIIQLYEKGCTITEIAKLTAIPRSTVGRIVQRLA